MTTTDASIREVVQVPRGATQVVGNIGMYFAAYRLSLMGWNVMPTSRNARGIDLLAYSTGADRYLGIQVKALSKLKPPVPVCTENLIHVDEMRESPKLTHPPVMHNSPEILGRHGTGRFRRLISLHKLV